MYEYMDCMESDFAVDSAGCFFRGGGGEEEEKGAGGGDGGPEQV